MTIIEFMRQASKMCDFSLCGYKTGCVAVRGGEIIAKSFNETLKGEIYCQNGECFREKNNLKGGKDIEKVCSIHAEANLIASAAADGLCLKGAEIYITTFPCLICSRSIVKAGFSKVYYMSDYGNNDGMSFFEANNIQVKKILEEELWSGPYITETV